MIDLRLKTFPEEALSLLLKTVDMDYIQDGNTMIVGYKERLTTVFLTAWC